MEPINFQESALWQRINNYDFSSNNPNLITFYTKMQSHYNLSEEKIAQLEAEFKRFIFLLCTQKQPLGPSTQIDWFWHTFLLFTDPYINDFCANVTQRMIHHIPSKGGTEEYEKQKENYENTLSLYSTVFGTAPPSDLWESSDERFTSCYASYTDRRAFSIIPKEQINSAGCLVAIIIFILMLILIPSPTGLFISAICAQAVNVYLREKLDNTLDVNTSSTTTSCETCCGDGCGCGCGCG